MSATNVKDKPPRSGLRSSRGQRAADPFYRGIMLVAASSVLVILAAMIIRTGVQAWPVFESEGIWGFLSGTDWNYGYSRSEVTGTYGVFPFIYGTLMVSLIAILMAVPLSIGIALFINELAPKRLKQFLAYAVDMLAMVPSIVYAFVGMYFFRVHFWEPVGSVIADSPLGLIPLFEGPVLLSSYWSAGNVLAIMILPIITAICRDVFSQVPADERNAAFGLGATRWEVMSKVILPRGFGGIVGGTMLGLGRALGETLAVAVLIGSTRDWAGSIFQPGDAMTALIANTFQEAPPETIWALLAVGVTLFFITMIVNMGARLIVSRVSKRVGGGAVV